MASNNLAALKIDRSRRRWRVSPWVWGITLAVAIAAALSPHLLARLQVVEVKVAKAERVSPTGELLPDTSRLTAAGYVVADRQSVLAAKFTGRLAKLFKVESQDATEGELVAEMDHNELDATIAEAQSEVAVAAAEAQRLRRLVNQAETEIAAAKAALQTFDAENQQYEILRADAQRRLELDEKLAARHAVSTSQLDDRRTEVLAAEAKIVWTKQRKAESQRQIAVAEARTDAARAAVAVADAKHQAAAAHVKVLESQRDESFIRAPFNGKVIEKAAEVGEIVAPISIGGSMARGSIVTLAKWDSRQAEVDVAESQLKGVWTGQTAEITVDAIRDDKDRKEVFSGIVSRILPRADRSKATVKVRVAFDKLDDKIKPEMGVRVEFLPRGATPNLKNGQRQNNIVVPAAAVRSSGSATYVWVVSGSDASRRDVQVGPKSGKDIEIEGLKPGEKVVVSGAERLSGKTATVKVAE
jgi:HlyD family secretion protein